MIFNVNFGGGLGNQMFKYAFLLSLLEKYPGAVAYKDTMVMSPRAHDGYELEKVFGIQLQECNPYDIEKYKKFCYEKDDINWRQRLLYRGTRALLPKPRTLIFQKDFSEYYPTVYDLEKDDSYYIYGVWANEKYFSHIKNKVLSEFQFRNEISLNAQKFLCQIESTNSVSIHVRRGDYEAWGHQLLGLDYYRKAVEIINEEVENPCYFVFSDDIEECRKIFSSFPQFTYVDCKETDIAATDMYLMSRCKHNIIANSTFSFWGAYLNNYPKRNVIACKEPLGMLKNAITCSEWINI